MRRAVLTALSALSVDQGQLHVALAHRDPEAAKRAIRTAEFTTAVERLVVPELRATFANAAVHEGKHGRVHLSRVPRETHKATGRSVSLGYNFNSADPRVAQWAQQQGAKLVVEITDRTRDAIRGLVATALREGGHPYALADQIRPLIGLHERYATAVLRYQQRLTDEGILSSERIAALASGYYGQLLDSRAETIARTEVLAAENAGRAETWQQAVDMGLLPPDATKQWVATGDAEPVCADLDGTEVALDDEFDGGDYGSVDMPPLHPNCRCTAVVISPTGVDTGQEIA